MLTPEDIGRTVRQERKRLGLRQDALAAAAGVGVRFIVELERGKASLQLGRALTVLHALGVDLTLKTRRPPASE